MCDHDIAKFRCRVLSGEDFKGLFPILHEKLFKLTNEEENHNSLQFKTGENIDFLDFNPVGECQKGGIYFTDLDNIPCWVHYNGKDMKYCRPVKLSDECSVYIENNKIKANEIILEDRVEISDLPFWSDEEFCLNAVTLSDKVFKYIKNITDEIQLASVKKYPYLIGELIDLKMDIPEEVLIYIVAQNGHSIKILLDKALNLSEDVQFTAVNKTGYAIKYILEKNIPVTEKVQLAAVKNYRYAIRDLLDHNVEVSEDVQIAAASLYDDAVKILLDHNINVSDKVKSASINKNF